MVDRAAGQEDVVFLPTGCLVRGQPSFSCPGRVPEAGLPWLSHACLRALSAASAPPPPPGSD